MYTTRTPIGKSIYMYIHTKKSLLNLEKKKALNTNSRSAQKYQTYTHIFISKITGGMRFHGLWNARLWRVWFESRQRRVFQPRVYVRNVRAVARRLLLLQHRFHSINIIIYFSFHSSACEQRLNVRYDVYG